MAAITERPILSYYLGWVVLTTLALPTALLPFLAIIAVIDGWLPPYVYVDGVRHLTLDYFAGYLLVPIVGLFTGIFQFALLRVYFPRMGGWVFATLGGGLLGLLTITLSDWLDFWAYESFNIYRAALLMGLAIGVCQWLLLRRRLARAGWWIAANVVGWGFWALIAGNSVGQFDLLAVGLVPTCLTAVTLAFLINQVAPSAPLDV